MENNELYKDETYYINKFYTTKELKKILKTINFVYRKRYTTIDYETQSYIVVSEKENKNYNDAHMLNQVAERTNEMIKHRTRNRKNIENKNIKEILQELVSEKIVTTKEVAELGKVSKSTVDHFKNGTGTVSGKTFEIEKKIGIGITKTILKRREKEDPYISFLQENYLENEEKKE